MLTESLYAAICALPLIALACGDSASNPPSSSATHQQAQQQDRGSENLPVVVKVLSPEQTKEELAKEEKREHERLAAEAAKRETDEALALYTKLLFAATAILAIATGLLVRVGFLQVRDAKGIIAAGARSAAAAESAAKATRDTAEFAGQQTAILGLQADIFTKQKEIARQQFLAMHRPIIRIKHVWLMNEMLDDEKLHLNLVFTNIGGTPARIESWGIRSFILPKDDQLPPITIWPQSPLLSREPLVSGYTYAWEWEDVDILDHADAISIRSKDYKLYLLGYIQYTETGGIEPIFRRTNFCRVLEVPHERRLGGDTNRFRIFHDADYEYQD